MGKDGTFAEKVYAAVASIPEGKVATYGQVAEIAGNPGAARAVGGILHKNADPAAVPCHRVVDAHGRPGRGYAFGGPAAQLKRLADEGVELKDGKRVDLKACRYKANP